MPRNRSEPASGHADCCLVAVNPRTLQILKKRLGEASAREKVPLNQRVEKGMKSLRFEVLSHSPDSRSFLRLNSRQYYAPSHGKRRLIRSGQV